MSAVIVTALLLGAAGYLALAWYVWRRRSARAAGALLIMLLAVGFWTLSYAIELSSRQVSTARVWSGLKFVGIVALPPALWSFVMEYTGRGRLSRRTMALLAIEPVLVLGLLAVPATEDLIHVYPADPAQVAHVGSAPVPDTGPLFWPHAIYTYVLMLGATGALAVRLVRVARPYRRPAYAMIVASVLPFLANFAYNLPLFGTIPDPTPFAFTLTAAVLVWGLFRLHLLDVMPVARGVVLEQMTEGVLVLDVYGRIVDANPAGARLLSRPRSELVGRQLGDLVPALNPLLSTPARGTLRSESEIRLDPGSGGPAEAVDLTVSITELTDPDGRQTASLLVLRDVTDQKHTERRMRELLVAQTEVSQTLQASLRPAPLPDVFRLRVTGRSIPARLSGPLVQVGGDFYDVHPVGEYRWAFVVGDVSGKGVNAAVVTSLARHTVRTLSAQPWLPYEVLTQLNKALQLTQDAERFCTAAYGQITYPPGQVQITLALGGHPQPLLRLRDGTVRAVGIPGTALGLLPEVDVRDDTVNLSPGDALLVYTDGVTEARRGPDQFGEERLAAVVAEAGSGLGLADGEVDARRASLLADAVADRVIAAVEEFAVHDDVALLVLAAC